MSLCKETVIVLKSCLINLISLNLLNSIMSTIDLPFFYSLYYSRLDLALKPQDIFTLVIFYQ